MSVIQSMEECEEESELMHVELQLHEVSEQLFSLTAKKRQLMERKKAIEQNILKRKRQLQESTEPDWTSSHSFPWCARVKELAVEMFGFDSLREGQWEIINGILSNYDVFAVMKTGGGKSLCYQLPALIDSTPSSLLSSSSESVVSFTVVVSPLLALIRDQVQAMNKILPGSAMSLAGKMDRSAQSAVYNSMSKSSAGSNLKLLYVTPEKINKSKLLMTHLQRAYKDGGIQRFVIDEAHCASQWGHDFRPDYAKLHVLRVVFPTVPLLLLTATANSDVRQDVITMLQLEEEQHCAIKGLKVFIGDFDRPNLIFQVAEKSSNFEQAIADILSYLPSPVKRSSSLLSCASRDSDIDSTVGSGNAIVYCYSQKECVTVSNALVAKGVRSAPYHAGLDEDYRYAVQDEWVAGSIQVICATIAFGLGINMPSVRVVVHYTMSKSMELYYQEAGRAGRDGFPAKCILLYAPDDVTRIAGMAMDDVEKVIVGAGGSTSRRKIVSRPKVLSMIKYCQGRICRRKLLSNSLDKNGTTARLTCLEARQQLKVSGKKADIRSLLCDNCSHNADIEQEKFAHTSNVHDFPVTSTIKAELGRIFFTMFDAVKEIVKADAEACAIQHTEKSSTLTLKKCSSDPKMKKALKSLRNSVIGDYFTQITVQDVEYFLTALLECGVLSLYYHFTPYASLCYIQSGHYFDFSSSESIKDVLKNAFLSDVMNVDNENIHTTWSDLIHPWCFHFLPKKCFDRLRIVCNANTMLSSRGEKRKCDVIEVGLSSDDSDDCQ